MTELSNTSKMMNSEDWKERFIAEYWQTKIRYERLKKLNTRIEAHDIDIRLEKPKHTVPKHILRKQQEIMGDYLHILELRAVFEDIDLERFSVTKTENSITISSVTGGNVAPYGIPPKHLMEGTPTNYDY